MRARFANAFIACVGCLLAMFATLEAGATSVLPLDLDQLVAGAREIVHVRCIGNQFQPDAFAGAATVSTFVVLDRAKGNAYPILTVRQPGGELNGHAIDFHVPKFKVGDEYVLFMPAPSAAGFASPVGLTQGAFGVHPAGSSKQVGNGRALAELIPGAAGAAAPNASAKAPGAEPAPASPSRMDLADFMTLVRTRAGGK